MLVYSSATLSSCWHLFLKKTQLDPDQILELFLRPFLMSECTTSSSSFRSNSPSTDIDWPPTTPKKKYNVFSILDITSQSANTSSHGEDQVPPNAPNLDQFVTEDLKNWCLIPFQDFLELILFLPKDSIDSVLQEVSATVPQFDKVFQQAFDDYATVFGNQGTHEQTLYVPLAKLMSTATMIVKPDLRKVFYVQDCLMVVGSIKKSPDLCVIWAKILQLKSETYTALITYMEKYQWQLGSSNSKKLKVFWGGLAAYLEIKHHQGLLIGLGMSH